MPGILHLLIAAAHEPYNGRGQTEHSSTSSLPGVSELLNDMGGLLRIPLLSIAKGVLMPSEIANGNFRNQDH